MRSALDLTACELVNTNGGTTTRDTCFPISKSSAAHFESVSPRALNGATDTAIRLIRRLKPYPGGSRLLVQMHVLDILDKHRLVLVVGAANKQLVLKLRMPHPGSDKPIEFPAIALTPADRQFPLEDGEEVFRVCAAARSPGPPMEHAIVFELAFGDNNEIQGHPLLPTLEAMHDHVSRIVEIVARQLLR